MANTVQKYNMTSVQHAEDSHNVTAWW